MVVVLFLCVTGAKVKNKNMQKLVKCSVPLVLFVALMLCMSKTVEPYCDPTDVVDALNAKGTEAGPGDTITLTTDGANAVTTAMSVDGVDYGYNGLGTAGGDQLATIRDMIGGGSNVDIIPSDELSNYADCTGDNLKPVLDWACSNGGGSDGANCEEEWPTNRMVWGIVQGEIGATSSGIAYSDITAAAELNSTQCKRAVNTQYCNALTTEVVSAIQSAAVTGGQSGSTGGQSGSTGGQSTVAADCRDAPPPTPSATFSMITMSGSSGSGFYTCDDGTKHNITCDNTPPGPPSWTVDPNGGAISQDLCGTTPRRNYICTRPPPNTTNATIVWDKSDQYNATIFCDYDYEIDGSPGTKSASMYCTGANTWEGTATGGPLPTCVAVAQSTCQAKDQNNPADVRTCSNPFNNTGADCNKVSVCEWVH